MKKILKQIAPDILMILGLLALSVGAAMIYIPAGLIVGGGCLIFSAWAAAGGGT